MGKKFLLHDRSSSCAVIYRTLPVIIAGFLFLFGTVNCGGNKSASQPPKKLIQDFIAKHQTMVDTSLVNYYVQQERKDVAKRVQNSISAKKAEGTLESMQEATFDFSDLKLTLIGEKEDYFNDELKTFIRVAVKGSYIMQQQNSSQTIPADETIILEKVGDGWKVTEDINPWG